MKISYRTHPILKQLQFGKLSGYGLYKEDTSFGNNKFGIDRIEKAFNLYAEKFNSNIKLITNPFFDAIEFAKKKMLDKDVIWIDKPECGTFLFPNDYTVLYNIEKFTYGEFKNICFIIFQRGNLMSFSDYVNEQDNYSCNSELILGKMRDAQPGRDSEYYKDQATRHYLSLIIATINFIKYCPVETVELQPDKKVKTISCKYINETNSKIQIMDSTWFTNFVKPDPFMVRRHLRWQQKKKDGEWTHELIWIDEYQKSGYTGPAKKLNQ